MNAINQTMNTAIGFEPITEIEALEIQGGFWFAGPLVGAAIAAIYTAERNPGSYTWLMDWYYADSGSGSVDSDLAYYESLPAGVQ